MDTSKSIDEAGYVAGALIFSGRPDPVWPLEASVSNVLLGVWDSMAQHTGEVPLAPPLGYRGCFMRAPSGIEWLAYRGVVTMTTDSDMMHRRDDHRRLEREILKTAPEGEIPGQFLAAEFE